MTLYWDHLASLAVLSISRAGQLASALEFLAAPATGSPAQQAQRLAGRLIEEPPGSFWVDEPFLEVLFQVIADRSDDDPRRTARLLLNSPFTLEDMVLAQPAATATIFRSDFAPASALVRGSDSLLALPWWIMYRLIKADPALGAQLSAEFHRRGETKLVAESLGYLAYDKDRQERPSLLPTSLEADGDFLGALFRARGADWLQTRLRESVALFQQRVYATEASPEFLDWYRETLEFAAAFLSDPETRNGLTGIIHRAFGL